VYVLPFTGAAASGRKRRISINGGSHPRWRRDGNELFYLSADRKLMAVETRTAPDFHPGIPQALFQTRLRQEWYMIGYDVAADGKRFLLNNPPEDAVTAPITVVLNWKPALK
jgi:hypothetical protein